jgi:hypothetical protein
MRKLIVALICAAACAVSVPAQTQQPAPTLRIVSEDGNRLPAELFYGNTKVRPLRLRPGTNTPITIDDADFFVQQHYVDFLSRFPDQGGFSFWQSQIDACGVDAQCKQVRRINVSAAFFLSIEFQETGYYVYRFYKAAYGDINPPSVPVPVRREEFMPDTRRLAQNVIVGIGNWKAQLEANKAAYAQEFVSTSRFRTSYPASMTAAAFVEKLNQNVGGVLSAAEKTELEAILGATPNDTARRAQVVRRVAENGAFSQAEFNRAFVLMQYFGYLKRNPNDAPDKDYSGWQFWLDQLNRFDGNFERAQMVRAFIESIEYRQRF